MKTSARLFSLSRLRTSDDVAGGVGRIRSACNVFLFFVFRDACVTQVAPLLLYVESVKCTCTIRNTASSNTALRRTLVLIIQTYRYLPQQQSFSSIDTSIDSVVQHCFALLASTAVEKTQELYSCCPLLPVLGRHQCATVFNTSTKYENTELYSCCPLLRERLYVEDTSVLRYLIQVRS